MRIHSVTFRLTSYLGLLLITAVADLTTAVRRRLVFHFSDN